MGDSKRRMGRALSGRSAASRFRPWATALHGLIGASAKLHREWIVKAEAGHRIRETGWLKAWRGDAVARRSRSRPCWPNTASPANCSTARPSPRSSRALCRSIKWACCTRRLPRSIHGRGGQGLCADVHCAGGDVRQADVKAIVPDGDRWRVVLAEWRDFGAPCRGRAGTVVGGNLAAARLPCSLAYERGYHREFKPNPAVRCSVRSMTSTAVSS